MTDEQLVDKLIDAAYVTGYYSGRGENKRPHPQAAIEQRQKLRQEILRRLKERTEYAEA